MTELAQALLTGFLTEIRDHHKTGNSWNGEYDISHMVVVDNCVCKITKQPHAYEGPVSSGQQKSQIPDGFHTKKNEDPFARAKVADVKKLEQIFSPVLIDQKGKKLEGDSIPVFYESLQTDMKNVTSSQVSSERFWEYILNHLALKPPLGPVLSF